MDEGDQFESQVEDLVEEEEDEEEEYEHDESAELADEVEPNLGEPNGVVEAEDEDELEEEEDASDAPELEQEGHLEDDKMQDSDVDEAVNEDEADGDMEESHVENEDAGGSEGEEDDEEESQLRIDNVEGSLNDVAGRKRSASSAGIEEEPRSKVGRNEGDASDDDGGEESETDQKQDRYCWVCHKPAATYNCKMCPRSYHTKCFNVSSDCPQPLLDEGSNKCVCPECVLVMNAEEYEKRSDAMKQVNMEQLTNMLKLICRRMKETPGSDPFQRPVLSSEAPDYYDFVVYPMDIQTLEANVNEKQYGSPEAFLADAQWIVHNSVVFNSPTSPYSHTAKRILKVCKTELAEIEACPECYMSAHTKPDTWFTDACKRPHIIVWAKLKGFPYWPAKAMKIKNDMVDARFFGQHDKSWVALKDCFLYSEEMPSNTKKNASLLAAIEELDMHLNNLREMFGEVTLAPPKTPLGRELSAEEIRKLVPGYNPDAPSPRTTGVKAAKVDKKSPLTLKITSIKSKPTVTQNQSAEEEEAEKPRKPVLRAKRPSETSSMSSNSCTSEATKPALKVPATELPQETTTVEKEEEKEKDEEIEEKHDIEPSVPNGEILANALGLKPKRRSSAGSSSMANDTRAVDQEDKLVEVSAPANKRTDTAIPQGTSILQQRLNKVEKPINQEYLDSEEVQKDSEDVKQKKNLDFMEHFSNQAQTKPGTRINISKDISISAVGKDDVSDDEPMDTFSRKVNTPQAGLSITSSMLQSRGENFSNNQRMLSSGNSSKGRFGPPRFLNPGGESKILSKMLKPSHGVPIPGAKLASQFQHRPLRAVPGALPADKVAFRQQPSTTHLLQKLAKEGSMGGKSSTSTSQAITLPGGTITVTPLAHGKSADTPPPLKPATNGPDHSSRKSTKAPANRSMSSSMVPGSVVQTVQTLQNSVNEMIRTAAESIARDMVDHVARGDDNKGYKQEIERYKKELVDLRRSNEVLMKEVLAQKDADKKRTVAELKHIHERDKAKAVEQAKRKQWCANCLQESSLYCCWNTSYCGYECQESHWPAHMNSCAQNTGGK